jgi:hypothetical protein
MDPETPARRLAVQTLIKVFTGGFKTTFGRRVSIVAVPTTMIDTLEPQSQF